MYPQLSFNTIPWLSCTALCCTHNIRLVYENFAAFHFFGKSTSESGSVGTFLVMVLINCFWKVWCDLIFIYPSTCLMHKSNLTKDFNVSALFNCIIGKTHRFIEHVLWAFSRKDNNRFSVRISLYNPLIKISVCTSYTDRHRK